MADLKLVGAVAIKVRPNAKGFKKETEDQIRDQLKSIDASVKVKLEVDPDQAKKDAEKAAKEIEKRTVSMKVGLDHDSVVKAQKKFEAMLEDKTQQIKFNLDDQGTIDKAREDLAEMRELANVEMTIAPDEKGFQSVLDKIAQIRREKMEIPLSFGVSDEELDALEESMNAALFEPTMLELSYTNDRASLQKAIDQIDAELDKIEAYELPVWINAEDLEIAKEQLVAELAGIPVELEVNYNDQSSLKAVHARLKAMLVELGSEKLMVEFNEQAIQEQIDRIGAMITEEIKEVAADPTTLKLNYNINRSSLTSALNKIDAELDKIRQLEIEIDLDPDALTALRERIQNDLDHLPVELTINYDDQDSLKQARSKLMSMLNETIGTKIDITMDEEKIRAELDKVNALIQEEIPKEKKVAVPVEPTGLEILARQLQFASRARRVPFFVVIDAKSVAVAEGILRSLAGVNTLQSLGRGLEDIVTKFDTFSLKTAAWSGAIGGLVDSLFFLTSGVFTVGEGMLQVVGLAALAPTAFAAIASTMLITTAVFKDFGAAAHGIDAAFKRLPPSGQKAALIFEKLFADMRENLTKEFWGEASDSMLRFTETALPAFTRGLVQMSGKLGMVFAGILDSFTKMGASGGLDAMYNNLGTMFDNASAGATALWDAINLLGLRGSEFLPQFGTWLSEISIQFNNWLTAADKRGDIVAWIEGGVTSLRDMWYSAGALIDQFKAVANAAGLLGNNGLDDFRRTMEHIARVMGGEPWQSQMGTIFDGARSGARELNDGFQALGRTMLDSASYTGSLLTLLGQFGGDFLTGLATAFGNFEFQTGTLDSLRGVNEMLRELEPSFDRMGGVMGRMASVAAQVFSNLAPVINSIVSLLDDVTRSLEDNLTGIAPALLTLSNSLINFARLVIMPVVEGFNLLLSGLNLLPGPLRDVTVAFLTFLLLRNQFGAFATGLQNLFNKIGTVPLSASAALVSTVQGNFTKMADGSLRQVVRMKDGTDRVMNGFGTVFANQMTVAQGHVNRFNPDVIVTRTTGVIAGVASAVSRINGALALIGGLPGVAIGLLGVLIATIGGNAATASANIDAMKGSLDRVTGNASAETLKIIADNITNIKDAGDAFANFWRGVILNSKAGNETLDQLGLNVGDVARKITANERQYDTFITQMKALAKVDLGQLSAFMSNGELPALLKELPSAMKDIEKLPSAFANLKVPSAFSDVKGPADARLDDLNRAAEAAMKLGIGPERLKDLGGSVATLTDEIEEQRKAWEISQIAQKIYADTLGVTTARAAEVAAITQTLGDKSIDASSKVDAIRRSLDLLNNRTDQSQEFIKMDQLAAGLENAKAIAAAVKAAGDGLFKENGLLNSQSKAARDLFKILQEQADNVLVEAQTAYDIAVKNGDSAAVAAQKALAVVNTGKQGIAEFAAAVGLEVGALDAQFATFFGTDWTLVATFTGRPDLMLAAINIAKEAGVEFDGSTFTAWLLAQDDPAKLTVDDVIAYMQEHYDGITHKTTLDANPAPAMQVIQDVINNAQAFATDQYEAVLRAYNSTEPGVREALMGIATVTNPQWKAALLAALDQGSLSWVEYQLNYLARNRTMNITVTTTDLARDEAMANRMGGGAYNGAIINSLGKALGRFPLQSLRMFANGGIENHVAQIQRAGGPVRIWAEPETKAEAYIPYAQAKRPRSLSILRQVAKDFGYDLSKAQEYANGGIAGRSSSSSSSVQADVHIGSIHTVDVNEAVRKLRQSQRDALAVAGISSIGG